MFWTDALSIHKIDNFSRAKRGPGDTLCNFRKKKEVFFIFGGEEIYTSFFLPICNVYP